MILEPSSTSPNTLTVSGKKVRNTCVAYGSPDTEPAAAHAAVMAAADPDDVSTAEELLDRDAGGAGGPSCVDDGPARWVRRRKMTPWGHQCGERTASRSGNHQYGLARLVSRLVGIRGITRIPPNHIDPAGPNGAPGKVRRGVPVCDRGKTSRGCRRGRMQSTRFGHSRPA